MIKPRIKICCISSKEEAFAAVEAGASALGLVAEMPSGPGVISDEEICRIASAVPPPVGTFLLTSRRTAREIVEHHRKVCTTTIQIVDELEERNYAEIRAALPGVKLVQVVHVTGEESVDEAIELAEMTDAILLDSGNPNLAVKELGGTGRRHDWRLSRKIVEAIEKPVFLAGGLRVENVREAIETVRPFGLDLCSGVRTNGKLDRKKLDAFFAEIEKI